jgi:hypothetical protein
MSSPTGNSKEGKGLKRESSEQPLLVGSTLSSSSNLGGRIVGGMSSEIAPLSSGAQQVMSPRTQVGPAKVRALSPRVELHLPSGEGKEEDQPDRQLSRLISRLTSESTGSLLVGKFMEIVDVSVPVRQWPKETIAQEEWKEYQEMVLEEYRRRWAGAVSELEEQQEVADLQRQLRLNLMEGEMMAAWTRCQQQAKGECDQYRHQELQALADVHRQCREYVSQCEEECKSRVVDEVMAAQLQEQDKCHRYVQAEQQEQESTYQHWRHEEMQTWEDTKRQAEQRFTQEVSAA